VSRASRTSSGSNSRAALSSRSGASLPRPLANAIWPCSRSALARWSSSSGPAFAVASSPGISFVIGFTVRLLALYLGSEEPLAPEPAGVYQHSDGRPLLGRKIAGKSQRELKDLGLAVENPAPASAASAVAVNVCPFWGMPRGLDMWLGWAPR